MFAVIKTGGKQYRVASDDVIKVERLKSDAGENIVFEDVLLIGDEDATTVGAPTVSGATVTGEVVGEERGKKVIAFKKRRRQNSRRTRGHRQTFTVVKITDILTEGGKSKAKRASAPKKADDEVAAATADTNTDAATGAATEA